RDGSAGGPAGRARAGEPRGAALPRRQLRPRAVLAGDRARARRARRRPPAGARAGARRDARDLDRQRAQPRLARAERAAHRRRPRARAEREARDGGVARDAVHAGLVPHAARGRGVPGRAARHVPLPADVAAGALAAAARAEPAGRTAAGARGRRHRGRGGAAAVTRGQAGALGALGSLVFVVCCLLDAHGLRDSSLYSDVHVYARYAGEMAHGRVPYRDFSDEYPPLAQPVFLAGRVAGAGNYALAFKALMAACGVGALVCGVATLHALRASLPRAVAAVAVIAVSPLLVGPIFLNAYDLWPALLLSLALLLLVRGRGVWPLAALGAGGLEFSYRVQATRGLELNSLGASILLAAGHPHLANEAPGSLNV